MTELLSRQHQNNVTKEEYNLLFCYKNYQLETPTTLQQIHLHFLLIFRLVSSTHSHNCYI